MTQALDAAAVNRWLTSEGDDDLFDQLNRTLHLLVSTVFAAIDPCETACSHVLDYPDLLGAPWTALGLAHVLARRGARPSEVVK